MKLNPTGTTHIIRYVSGRHQGELSAQIALDAAGNVYRRRNSRHQGPVGTPAASANTTYPTTASAYQPTVLGGQQLFRVRHANSLRTENPCSTPPCSAARTDNTYNNALAVSGGKIFIGGYTQDPHLPTTAGAISKTCPGGPTAAGPDTICSPAQPMAMSPSSIHQVRRRVAGFLHLLEWSVSPQGNESSQVNALAADAAGNVYVGG